MAVHVAADSHEKEILERIKPFGSVCIEGSPCPTREALRARQNVVVPEPTTTTAVAADVAAAPLSGEEVYSRFCSTCHDAAVAGAPLVHDAEQWAPRLAKGMDALMQTTLSGVGAMPPKGMCMACSDEELQEAINFMAEESP